jgi:hypothetical protein
MRKIWKKINSFYLLNGKELTDKLIKKGYIISPWIIDIIKKKKFSHKKYDFPILLYKLNLRKDLNIRRPIKLINLYNKIKKKNFSLVEPEIAIFSRMLYKKQPSGEWLRFATDLNSMIDSDGVPHLPKLGAGLGKKFVETYWAYPNAIFHPHNDFIVSLKK